MNLVMGNYTIILGILSLIATIVCCIFILPRKNDGHFPTRFGQFLHDLFHFKRLWLEYILKVLYIFETLFVILCGFSFLFMRGGYAFLIGLGVMILGPIAVRILYELMMMLILLVQNVIDINRKLGPGGLARSPRDKAPSFDPSSAPAPTPAVTFCSNCGAQIPPESEFCPICGKKP